MPGARAFHFRDRRPTATVATRCTMIRMSCASRGVPPVCAWALGACPLWPVGSGAVRRARRGRGAGGGGGDQGVQKMKPSL